jgi:hypothetical protein
MARVRVLVTSNFHVAAANQLQNSSCKIPLELQRKFEKAAILCYNKRLGRIARAEIFHLSNLEKAANL